MYRIRDATCRALLSLCAALALLPAAGLTAHADEPVPRAIPEARMYPRAFATYEALVAFATGVARTQGMLDGRLHAVREERASVAAMIESLLESRSRGGSLFEPDERVDVRALVAELRERAEVLARAEGQLIGSGALTAEPGPWRMATRGVATQGFGPTTVTLEPPRTYRGVAYKHFHEGVDISGGLGAAVVAPARGRVVFVGLMGDGAQVVVLAHDGGLVSMYAHLDAWSAPPPVRPGDEVAAGQRIGTVGLTGMTTGPHLHWVTWRDGVLVDPLALVGASG